VQLPELLAVQLGAFLVAQWATLARALVAPGGLVV
jgi:hypothetical protein